MLNIENKFIFLHVPKNGGTSFEKIFKYRGRKHNRQKDYVLKLKKLGEKYEEYIKVAIARNPWDKAVSEYKWHTNNHMPFPAPCVKELFNGMDFKSFLKKFLEIKKEDIPEKDDLWFYQHFESHQIPQVEFLDPVENIDVFIRFESLQEDFDNFMDSIGLENIRLPHIFKNKRKDYTEYYDAESIKIIKDVYSKDIEYFGYKFGQ